MDESREGPPEASVNQQARADINEAVQKAEGKSVVPTPNQAPRVMSKSIFAKFLGEEHQVSEQVVDKRVLEVEGMKPASADKFVEPKNDIQVTTPEGKKVLESYNLVRDLLIKLGVSEKDYLSKNGEDIPVQINFPDFPGNFRIIFRKSGDATQIMIDRQYNGRFLKGLQETFVLSNDGFAEYIHKLKIPIITNETDVYYGEDDDIIPRPGAPLPKKDTKVLFKHTDELIRTLQSEAQKGHTAIVKR